MPTLTKVVSGGQTGVDQAALRAARDCGLETGGWCPPGRECEGGTIPAEFPLKETPTDRSPNAPGIPRSQRTEWNVRDSDGTLVIRLAGKKGPGTNWTMKCARRYQRPLVVCDAADPGAWEKIVEWAAQNAIGILNVAGPSESADPGIAEKAYALLRNVFAHL